MTEREAYDMFLEYMKYDLLVINNPDVASYSTILKMFMLSGIKDWTKKHIWRELDKAFDYKLLIFLEVYRACHTILVDNS
jgi:hypothetical protein